MAQDQVNDGEGMPWWLASLAFLVGLYLLLVSASAVLAIYILGFTDWLTIERLGVFRPGAEATLEDVRCALLSGVGAMLGACVLGFVGLFKHAVTTAGFNPRFLGSYLLGPLAVILLGLIAFVLVRTGLLAFGGPDGPLSPSLVARLSYTALGILVGFSWQRMIARVATVTSQFLSADRLRATPPSE